MLGFVHPLGCGLMSGLTILVGALMTYFWVVLFRGYQQISKSHEIEEVEDYDTFAENSVSEGKQVKPSCVYEFKRRFL